MGGSVHSTSIRLPLNFQNFHLTSIQLPKLSFRLPICNYWKMLEVLEVEMEVLEVEWKSKGSFGS
ncbi:MAG: hypothetical protein ABJJ43_06595 [Ekhidna sp.]